MRSLRWRRNRVFAENTEWLSSPENHGLYLPFHELFCPGLSKSAPCKCCPSGSNCTTCACCNALRPALKLSDSVYGGPWNLTPSSTTQSVTLNGAANCAQENTCSNITTNLTYTLSCSGGAPNFYFVTVAYFWCSTQNSMTTGGAFGASVFSNHSPVITSLDCAHLSLTFTVSGSSGVATPYGPGPAGKCNPNPSGNSATITVVPQ